MNSLSDRIAGLSPEKQALLLMRLQKKKAKKQQIPPRSNLEEYPLSFAQQRLWFLDQLEPNSPLYNIPGALRLQGNLDVEILQKSIHHILQRHEPLRANFMEVQGKPIQFINQDVNLQIPLIELQSFEQAARKHEVARLAEVEAKRPFNLSHDPLFRATLLKCQPDEHILLLTVHHIAFDGWSTNIFIEEIATIYHALLHGETPYLPNLPIQYADFAHWQQTWLNSGNLAEQQAYWKDQLGNQPPILELPTDYPRPPMLSDRGAHYQIELPRQLTSELKDLATETKTTLFMLLLTAFNVLLFRYSHQKDICIGTPTANRNRSEIEKLIGFFVNTLVIRTDLSRSLTFRELLYRVRDTTLAAQSHQDIPFEMLVELLQPNRNMSHMPLFQVMFDLQKEPLTNLQLSGVNIDRLPIETGLSKFDLMLIVTETDANLVAEFEFSTDLFRQETIARMAGHLKLLLTGITSNPDQSIDLLPLLPETERRQLLVEWNDTSTDFPKEQCIHQLFETQVEKAPNAVAVKFEDQQYTYQELNVRANQLAHFLQNLGVGPEVLVGVCVERSLEMIVGILAILKSGGAYLPIDANYPPERLSFMLSDAEISVLLTQESLQSRLPETAVSTICLDSDWPTISAERDVNLSDQHHSHQLAYVMYTSGSTGRPKGTRIVHQSIVRLVRDTNYINMDAQETFLQLAPLPFDASTLEIWAPLLNGGQLVVMPPGQYSLADIGSQIKRHGITTLWLTAGLFHLMVDEQLEALRPLRQFLAGGDVLSVSHVKKAVTVLPNGRLFNGYGPTENTTFTCCYPIDPGQDYERSIPIGKPIANTEVYILDKQFQPVPIGVVGELYTGGIGLARDYLNRPTLTAEKFIPNPFSREPGSRLYKVGDLARYLPDGNIEFLGRIDHQVKIGGFRIELGEVETVLSHHSAVDKCVAIAREDTPGDKRLVAYLLTESDVKTSELREYLKERLPDHMIPTAFVTLDSYPVTHNGKIDRRALPAPDTSRPAMRAAYVSPKGPIEENLAEIWQEILGLEQIGVHDNFFELGGHSLLATQIASRIRKRFQVELPLRILFEATTIAALAKQIATLTNQADEIPIEPLPEGAKRPLSFSQQRLWFLDHLEPDSSEYNIADAIRIQGKLDTSALQAALNDIVNRHETLRSSFATDDAGQPTLQILPELSIDLPVEDLRAMQSAHRNKFIEQAIHDEARKPFNLDLPPLLRLTLLQTADDEHIALLTMHHIISDGWSMSVFIQDLATLYAMHTSQSDVSLPDLSIQFNDYAQWQRDYLQGETLDTQLAYWQHVLADSPPQISLPTDRPRPPVRTFVGGKRPFSLSTSLTNDLKALCQQENVTLFMTLLAAFQTLLHRYTGQENINIGTPIANRTHKELENLIGFFVNTLVMHGDLSASPTFRQLLQRTHQTALDAYAHQDIPFEMVVDALQPERNMSFHPLFQVMFAFQNAPKQSLELADLSLQPLHIEGGTAKFDLTLSITEEESRLRGSLEYNSDLFDASTIDRWIAHFQTLLHGIVDDPNQPIKLLPILPDAEKQQLLVDWNAPPSISPPTTLYHLFETQVERYPDNIALQFEHEQLSYAQLNQRANQMAHYLKHLGVTVNSRVGICIDRSIDMICTLLGVLKAGAAYIPLDPNYPTERIQFMIDDAQPRIVLTTKNTHNLHPNPQSKIVNLKSNWDQIAHFPTTNLQISQSPNSLAYIIYTSGSTGQPKGTMLRHCGVCNFSQAHIQTLQIDTNDDVLQFASLSFDASVAEIFTALLAGATLHLARRDTLLSVDKLLHLLQTQQISLAILPPSLLAALDIPHDKLPVLRNLISAGERCPVDTARRWSQGRAFWNGYGPTEATVGPIINHVTKIDEQATNIPIGRPLSNVQVYILDKQLQPVPIGVPGELHIGGICLAKGYLNQPDLTAERFIEWPPAPSKFNANGTAPRTIYKTGDLARYRPDGNIELLCRIDDQVKLRGFRIELGEIESALNAHQGVQKTAVLLHQNTAKHKQLVAYIVPNPAAAVEQADLIHFLRNRLPDYMVPMQYITLDQMPLLPNGKIDRSALPAPDPHLAHLGTDLVLPATDKETALAEIWQTVLGLPQIGIHDNFFELGGDSILTIQLVSRAQKVGLSLTAQQIFQHPTIAQLAAVAETAVSITAEQGIVTGDVPLTPIQHWFFDQAFAAPHHWNQSLMLEVSEKLDMHLLETAVSTLLEHHDALRLRFKLSEAGWQQTNATTETASVVQYCDLTSKPARTQQETITQEANKLQAGLHLENGPLVGLLYFHLGPEKPDKLLIVIHHLVVDGISWRILLEDLQLVYQQLSQKMPVQLPNKTTSFQQWATNLNQYAQSEALQEEVHYWQQMVTGKRPFSLPQDYSQNTTSNLVKDARNITVNLDHAETEALLRDVPAVYGTEINDILIAALVESFSQFTGQRSLWIALEGHGREAILPGVDLTRTVGWFTAAAPIHIDLQQAHSPGEAIKQTKEQLNAMPHKGIGYGILRYLSQNITQQQLLQALPEPEISFNYLGQFDQEITQLKFALSRESTGSPHHPNAHRPHLLDISGSISGGKLRLEWIYGSQIHKEETIQKLADKFIDALRNLIDHCQNPEAGGYTPSDFPEADLNEDELEALLMEIGD